MARRKITEENQRKAETQLQSLQRQVDYDTKDYTLELLLNKYELGE